MVMLLLPMFFIMKATSKWTKTATHLSPLAYDRAGQMVGMDLMKHGGVQAPESMTAYSPRECPTRISCAPAPRERRPGPLAC